MQSVVHLSARTLWSVAGFVIALAAGRLIFDRATNELVLIFGAIVIAEGMRPLVNRLTAWRLPTALAVLVIYALAFAMLGALAWFTLSPLTAQVAELINNAPSIAGALQHTANHYQQLFQNNAQARALFEQAPSRIGNFLTGQISSILQAPVYAVGLVSNLFLILLLALFWLLASAELATFVLSVVPEQNKAEARSICDELSVKTGGYVRGVLINMVVIGLLSGFGVRFLGVQYTLVLGVVAGLTEAIPIVGPLLGGAVAVGVAAFTLGGAKALQVALLYVVIQQVEGNTLVPLVMNRVVSLHPLAIIVALLIGAALLGVPGAVLSVPAAAILQVLIVRIAAPAARRRAAAVQLPATETAL